MLVKEYANDSACLRRLKQERRMRSWQGGCL
jgi:hypothetical protein